MKRYHFTIIEIVAAMAIVMILLGLVMGGASVASRMAKDSRTRSQISAIEIALEQYRTYWGFYPEPDDDNAAMELSAAWFASLGTTPKTIEIDLNADGDFDDAGERYEGTLAIIDNTNVGMIEDATYGYLDPFAQPFYYQIDGLMNPQKFDLWSKGRDGKHGHAEKDDDDDGTVDNASDAQSTEHPTDPEANAKDSDDVTNWGRD